MRLRRFALALAVGLVSFAASPQARAGCGGCRGGGTLAVSGPGHVVSTQGTFTTGDDAPPSQTAPVVTARPAMASPTVASTAGHATREVMASRPPVAGRPGRRTR